MAKQLKDKGEIVEIVILIDSFNFSNYGAELVNATFSRKKGLERLLIKEGIDPMSEEAKLLKIETNNNKKLLMSYSPLPYSGRVALLKAIYYDNEDAEYNQNPSNGWHDIVKSSLEIFHIPARHEEFFDLHNVKTISKKIDFILNKLGASIV